ncbi:MAG: prepilin-type N-terminal cleavage/methylation domain-containing protein [Fimbriimonas sp.]|nr:prepilin-type N-terminal cleavage/methylation domain-containing protein [Fimbriimonas sp.]
MGRIRARAFTLVELLIVIILVAVLAAIAIPKISDRWRFASESRWKAQLVERRRAIERFRADTGVWPASINDVGSSSAPATGLDDQGTSVSINASNWRGPYLLLITSNNSTVLHPRVRSIRYTYDTTQPGVGTLRLNTNLLALDGSNMGAW